MELYDLRGIMISLITNYNTKKDKLNDNKCKIDIYDSVLSILNSVDEFWNMEMIMLLSIQLEILYEEEIVDDYMQIILDVLNKVKKLKEISEYKLDVQKLYQKLNKMIRDIQSDSDSLKVELKDLKNYLSDNSQLVYLCANILKKLKYGGLIDEKDKEVINYLMEEYQYDVKSNILVQEKIRIHNQKVKNPEFKISHTVENMMRRTLPKYEIDGYENKIYGEKNYKKIISYVEQIKQYDDEFLELLLEGLFEEVNEKEYNYIMKSILNRLVSEIESEIDEMRNHYSDIVLRKVLIDSYNSLYIKFNKIRKMYQDKLESLKVEEKPVKKIINRLFYPALVGSDSFAEKDLKDIPNEKLEELEYLINGFKSDELTSKENSQFTGSNKKLRPFRKLKGDQIRIMVKNIGGHNYAVAGIFIKKDNLDLNKYDIISNRQVNEEVTEDYIKRSEESEAKILKYIDEHKRKGSR